MERLHILDGYGYIFRAFYGLSGGDRGVRLTTSKGMPSGALYVYARMLIRLHLDVNPQRIVVVFDAPGPTFRSEIDPEYKATRRETPDDLQVQIPHFRPLTEAFSWPVVAVPGVEADDVIATLVGKVRRRGWDAVIYSGDKDLMQLVDDHVTLIDSMRQITYDAARVTEKFGVPPAQVRDWLALVGDSSDNVPGVAGVGKKTAAKLLGDYGTIEGILANTHQLKGKMRERFLDDEQLRRLRLSRELVTLRTTVDVDEDLDSFKPGPWDGDELARVFGDLEFQVLLDTLGPGQVKKVQTAPVQRPESRIAACDDDLVQLAHAAQVAKRVAIHVEHDGERADRAQVVGFALCVPGEQPLYVPVGHRYLSAPKQFATPRFPQAFIDMLQDEAVGIVCHDSKRLRRCFASMGITVRGIEHDTMLAAYVVDASQDSFAVERIVGQNTSFTIRTRKALVGSGRKAIRFESVTVEEAASLVGDTVYGVLVASETLHNKVMTAGQAQLLTEVELPTAALLSRLEGHGIVLDVNYLRELSDVMGQRISDIERHVFELAGGPINIGSPKQLGALLFDKLGLHSDRMKKKKTGYSTDHEVLESLRSEHEIVNPILEYRELVKLKGTYIDALPPLINPNTGRLHTSFNQAVTATGRLSSQDPNLQNIPIRSEVGRQIRRAFVAQKGHMLVSADYSQIELRILAHLSEDPVLVRAFNDDLDVHTLTAAEVFAVSPEQVDATQRRVAKAVNYGLVYGQSEFGLSRAIDVPRAEAKHYIEVYFERFAGVRKFMDDVVNDARKKGYSSTVLGRRRPIPDLMSRQFQRRSAAKRIAQNSPMQGSGADLLKLAMLRTEALLGEGLFDAKMLLTVHDELVFEVAEAQAHEFGQAVREAMESVYQLSVPLKVDVGIAANWADAHG